MAIAYDDDGDGQRHRDRMAKRSREKSQAVRDIGELPEQPIEDPARRERCKANLAVFLQTYFPGTFRDPFSKDHYSILAKMQRVVTEGGRFACAMPRSFGKTSCSEGAALYAILYGFRRYVVVVGAAAEAAKDIAKSLQDELESNELLLADFKAAIFPLQCLEGEPRRCLGQTYQGEKTRTEWGRMQVKFPTMPGSPSSGAMIRVAGITGQIRGKKGKAKDKDKLETFRPDLVIIDDPQTERSALSDVQCRVRERIINQTIVGLAGKNVDIAIIMPCTVIRAGDVAFRFLDHKIHPGWNGSKHKMLYEWPKNLELWDKYKEIRLSFNPAVPGEKEAAEKRATEFYVANRAAMDEGAVVAWEHSYKPKEVSSLQSCMNWHLDDPRGFAAECQQDPLAEENEGVAPLTAEEIGAKLNGLPRGHVPLTATLITCGIDVQLEALFYVVVAWEPNFTGHVIDYGSWPEQGRVYYRKSDLTNTIGKTTKLSGLEAQYYAAFEALSAKILARDWQRGDGGKMRIGRALIDANYEASTNTVYRFCLQSVYAPVLLPQHGRGIGPEAKPMSMYTKHPGETHDKDGMWIITQNPKRREIRYVKTDTNAIKSFLFNRLSTPMGGHGCLSLWGREPTIHQLFADHLTAEYPDMRTSEKEGRTKEVWTAKPNRDNDLLDCLVYATAAASIGGITLAGSAIPVAKKASWAERYAKSKSRIA